MGLFRLVARVGCLRRRGNPSPRGMVAQVAARRWTEPGLQVPWQFFLRAGELGRAPISLRDDGQADAIRRLGISPLAPLRREGPRGGARAPVRPRGLQRARRPARAQGAEQPRALDFCEAHAAEYNKNWNYFAGLTAEEAARARGRGGGAAPRPSQAARIINGAGPGDGSRSRDEMRALDALELEADADFEAVKAAYRRLAKEHHPDRQPGRQGSRQALPAGPGGL